MTGLRLDARSLARQFQQKLSKVTADAFRPEVTKFAKRTLETCVKLTPIRPLATIRAAQKKQYANRVNNIPSVHTLEDPTLIVKDDVHWLYAQGRWWPASFRELPSDIQAIHDELNSERERRLETSEGDFIAMRAQARFLYRRSWWEAGQSIGLSISVDQAVIDSHSRHNPPANPPKAYAQWRGGKNVLSVVIFNPFLETESRYKPFSGKAILLQATEINRPRFDADLSVKLARLMA